MRPAVRAVREGIGSACARAGRDPKEVRLVAVTKEVAAEQVRAAAEAGVTEFGENYVQELEPKRRAASGCTWHFLGKLQGNKVGRVLDAADVVQTLEPGRSWRRLAERAEERGRPIECLVQVDFTGERMGVAPEDAASFVEEAAARPGLRVVGLMTVPPFGTAPRPYFVRLRELRDGLRRRSPTVRELSMGMSADYQEAVEEGATMVRVGTAIFGSRP